MFMHSQIARLVAYVVLCNGVMGCRKRPETSPVKAVAGTPAKANSASATDEDDDLACLVEADHARIHLQFGYRGCFGGSDNDLDLDVGATASLSGHRWTGVSTNQVVENAPLTREKGRAYLRLFVDALAKNDEKNDEKNQIVSTTTAFVRVSYWCGNQRSGPLMFETNAPSEEDDRAFAAVWAGKAARAPHHHPYSPVHTTIALARNMLEAAPSRCGDSSAQVEAARRRLDSLYRGGMRVRHDPVEEWNDP